MIITRNDYDNPSAILGAYFNKKDTPSYAEYEEKCLHPFLVYLFYMLIMGAEGNYPEDLHIEQITTHIKVNKNDAHCPIIVCNPHPNAKGIFKKILLGEAPKSHVTYFYNLKTKWDSKKGRFSGKGGAWTHAIQTALFGNQGFASKADFLAACAKQGFLLYDLFPYAIGYVNRGNKPYKTACLTAFGANSTPFTGLVGFLEALVPFVSTSLILGFGLKGLGEAILDEPKNTATFNSWAHRNGITLFKGGGIELTRGAIIKKESRYLRVCGEQGAFGPTVVLLKKAGF